MSITDIIVGWDGSAPSRRALEWALQRPSDPATRILLVTVVDDSPAERAIISDERVQDAMQSAEIAAANAQRAHPHRDIHAVLRRGTTLQVLREYSTPEKLLVVGTHARHGARLRYGWSLGARLAGHAHGPVAVIPDTALELRSGIVAGVDDTPGSFAAADFAADEAEARGVTLHLVHAWQEPPVWQDAYAPSDEFLEDLARIHDAVARDVAEQIRAEHPMLTVRADAVRGTAAHAILNADPAPELVVVGSRGIRGLGRLLLGSVSHDLLLNLDIPAIVVGLPADADQDRPAAAVTSLPIPL